MEMDESVRGPVNCDCYNCYGKPDDQRGLAPCEYYDHHCAMCHEKRFCTDADCGFREEIFHCASDGKKISDMPLNVRVFRMSIVICVILAVLVGHITMCH